MAQVGWELLRKFLSSLVSNQAQMKSVHFAQSRSALPWSDFCHGKQRGGRPWTWCLPSREKGSPSSPLSALRSVAQSCSLCCAPRWPCLPGEIGISGFSVLGKMTTSGVRTMLQYRHEGNESSKNSPGLWYWWNIGKGFRMLQGWALWSASVLLSNHNRSTGELCPAWRRQKKSVLFYMTLGTTPSVMCHVASCASCGSCELHLLDSTSCKDKEESKVLLQFLQD